MTVFPVAATCRVMPVLRGKRPSKGAAKASLSRSAASRSKTREKTPVPLSAASSLTRSNMERSQRMRESMCVRMRKTSVSMVLWEVIQEENIVYHFCFRDILVLTSWHGSHDICFEANRNDKIFAG